MTHFRPRLEYLEERAVPSATLLVDDDGVQKPNAQFTSINAAILAANPGDTIKVFPGTYNESVLVNKSVALLGVHSGSAVERAGMKSDDPTKDAIIVPTGAGTDGFDVSADKVQIRGFTIENTDSGVTTVGIDQQATVSGGHYVNNLIEGHTFGMYLNSSTIPGKPQTVVRDNAFVNNNATGGSSGDGIYSDQGARNILIEDNFFTDDSSAAVVFAGTAGTQSQIIIQGNNLFNDSSIALINVEGARVANNHSDGANGSAIFLDGVSDVHVVNNRLTGQEGSTVGIHVTQDSAATQPSFNNVIRGNDISDFRRTGSFGILLDSGAMDNLVESNVVSGNSAGIGLENSMSNTVQDNTANHNFLVGIKLETSTNNIVRDNRTRHNDLGRIIANDGKGIALLNSDGNVISGNQSTGNAIDGVFVDSGSANNSIHNNTLLNNGFDDEHDQSTGSGTAGTANTWAHNRHHTASPAGLR